MASLCQDSNLTIVHMKAVLDELGSFARWKVLGRNLGVSEDKLDLIEEENKARERLEEVVKYWLKRNHNEKEYGPPSWSSLAKAVEPIDNAKAIQIRSNHGLNEQRMASNPPQQSSPDCSEEEPTDEDLRMYVAMEVSQPDALGTFLGLKSVQIEFIKQERLDGVSTNMKILTTWKEKETKKPITWGTIIKALRKMEMNKLAGQLEKKFGAEH